MFFTFKIGLILGLSIIICIGSQNLFVIRQGLRNEHPYLCALACFICDVILIILGVVGVSALIIQIPLLKLVMLLLGIIFLIVYGCLAIKRGFNAAVMRQQLHELREQQSTTVSATKLILLALSFSVLNPQAILDTMVIIGGNANHYIDQSKYLFVAGAITASFVWFLGLAVSTSSFAKQLMDVKFWCVLELISGCIMITFAIQFLWQIF